MNIRLCLVLLGCLAMLTMPSLAEASTTECKTLLGVLGGWDWKCLRDKIRQRDYFFVRDVSDKQLQEYIQANTAGVAAVLLQVDYGRDIAKNLEDVRGTFVHEADFVDALKVTTVIKTLQAMIDALPVDTTPIRHAGLESLAILRTIKEGYDTYRKAKGAFTALNTREALRSYFDWRVQQSGPSGATKAWHEMQIYEPILRVVGEAKGLTQDQLAVWFENAYAAYRLVAYTDSAEIRYARGLVIGKLATGQATETAKSSEKRSGGPSSAGRPSGVLESLAGRWDGVTSGGLRFVWTIDEAGQYDSVYGQSGKEVRRRGGLVIRPDGTLEYRSEDGQTGTLTVKRGESGPLRILGRVSGMKLTFEMTQTEGRTLGETKEQPSIAELQRRQLAGEADKGRRKQAIGEALEKAFEHFHSFGVTLVREYVGKGLVLSPPTGEQISNANAAVNAAAIPPIVTPAVKAQFEDGTIISIGTGMMGESGRALLIAPVGSKNLFPFGTWISGVDERGANCQVGVSFGWPDTRGRQATFVKYPCGTDVFAANKARFVGMFDMAIRAHLQR